MQIRNIAPDFENISILGKFGLFLNGPFLIEYPRYPMLIHANNYTVLVEKKSLFCRG